MGNKTAKWANRRGRLGSSWAKWVSRREMWGCSLGWWGSKREKWESRRVRWGSSLGFAGCSLQGSGARRPGRWVSSWVTSLHLKRETEKTFKW